MNSAPRFTTHRFRGMNTDIEIVLEQVPGIEGIFLELESWFVYVERTFSRFLTDSELSRINRSGGNPVLVSGSMLEVLQLAEGWRSRSGGLYDPFLLSAMEESGYTASYEQISQTKQQLPASLLQQAAAPFEGLLMDPGMGSVKLPSGRRLDLGGIVKGWAADRISRWCQAQGIPSGVVSAGGDLTVWGGTTHKPWPIDIEDPAHSGGTLAEIKLTKASIATSSTVGRRWLTNQGAMHHLIDPRTMLPSKTDIIQCSVVGESGADTEVMAKTVLLLGAEEGIQWLFQQSSHVQALLVGSGGRMIYAGTEGQLNEEWSMHQSADYVFRRPLQKEQPSDSRFTEGGETR